MKIMDARLDSSLATYPGAGTARFDVFSLLSPEEVCWIMDQTICAEVCVRKRRDITRGLTEVLLDGLASRSLIVSDSLHLPLLF